MNLNAHHVGIVVSDLERSKAFYRALGFAQREEHVSEDKTISFLELCGFRVELFAYREAVPAPPQPERALGFRHLALGCEDIDATITELKARGVLAPDVEPLTLPAGWRLLFFRDPDGVEIEITQA